MLRLTRYVLASPLRWIAGSVLVVGSLGAGLGRLELRTDGAMLRPAHHPTVEQTRRDQARFLEPTPVVVLLRGRGGEPVASAAGLELLVRLHDALRRLPGVRGGGVHSLAGLTDLRVDAETVATDRYLAAVPEDPAELAALLRRLRAHPMVDGILLSRDGRAAALYVPLATDGDRRAVLHALDDLLAEHRSPRFDLALTGPVVVESLLGEAIVRDLGGLIPLMLVLLLALLWTQLRCPAGLVIPVVEVAAVLLVVMGAMAWTGTPVTLVTTLLPLLLMALAITDEIHLLERVQASLVAARARGAVLGRERMRRSLLAALRELETPVVATSLTTSLGLAGFLFTSIEPLRHFGLFGALGVLLAMVLTFTLVPAVAVLLPAGWFLPRGDRRRGPAQRFEAMALRRPRGGLVAAGLVLAFALPGLGRLRVEDNWIANFAPDSPIVAAERSFNESFWGSRRFDVVLEAGPGHFFAGEGVALVEEVSRHAAAIPGVAGVLTYLSPVAAVAAAHGETGPLAALPAERVADYILMTRFSEDPVGPLNFMTEDGSSARVQLYLQGEDYRRDRELARLLEQRLREWVPGEVSWHFSGDIPDGLAMVSAIVGDQLRSVGLAFLAIGALLVGVFPRGRAGLAVLLPAAAACCLVFAGMGYLGIPLGIATSMFGSLAIGVGVDFGFHFVHRYQHERRRGADGPRSLAATLAAAGRAIRWSAVVLSLGFAVLWLSDLRPNHSLGLLLAAAMAATYLLTLLALPALALRWCNAGEPAAGRGAERPRGRLEDEPAI